MIKSITLLIITLSLVLFACGSSSSPNCIDKNCDDGNPCTDDICSEDGACIYTNNDDPCDDGLYCTDIDVCQGGICKGSGNPCFPKACDESNDNCFDLMTLATGDSHSCKLTAEGQAYCWGRDSYGQLGDGSDSPDICSDNPCSQIPVLVDNSMFSGDEAFVYISGGCNHTCGITTKGRAYCWGSDVYGQLGEGVRSPQVCGVGSEACSQFPFPVDTSGVTGEKEFVSISGGNHHTCGLTTDGKAYCWGSDFYGQIGDGVTSLSSNIPVPVETSGITGEKAFVSITVGDSHSCGLTTDGQVYCWGRDYFGQLGDGGSSTDSLTPVPVNTSGVTGDKSFVFISAGQWNTCGLTTEGRAYCWGSDQFGQLGDGSNIIDECNSFPCSQSPILVDTSVVTGGKAFIFLTGGCFHSCGLTDEGQAYCWGRDSSGQLGNGGTSNDSQIPVLVDTSGITGQKAFIGHSWY